MIHAFVERLRCGDHLIVRAGPLAKEFGRPYKKSCLGEIAGDGVTLMAFCEPWLVQLLRRWFPRIVGSLTPYVKASMRALYAEGFKQVHLDRLTANPRRLVFTQGDEEGKIVMANHSHVPHPHAARTAGGIDEKALEAGAAAANEAFRTKKEKMLEVDRIEHADGSVTDLFRHRPA